MNFKNDSNSIDDVLSFDDIYTLYYNNLCKIAYGYINNKHEAEEIVQNIFVKLWNRNQENYKVKHLNAYLFGITKNACLDYLKHQKVKAKFLTYKMQIDLNFINDHSSSLAIENELKKAISEAIELLPKKCRLVFEKSRYEGMKRKVIAKELGLSVKTVDNHINNATKHLKVHLKDYITSFIVFFYFLFR